MGRRPSSRVSTSPLNHMTLARSALKQQNQRGGALGSSRNPGCFLLQSPRARALVYATSHEPCLRSHIELRESLSALFFAILRRSRRLVGSALFIFYQHLDICFGMDCFSLRVKLLCRSFLLHHFLSGGGAVYCSRRMAILPDVDSVGDIIEGWVMTVLRPPNLGRFVKRRLTMSLEQPRRGAYL